MPSSADNAPADFESYWDDALAELGHVPPVPETELMPIRTTDFATMYGVRLTSVGRYRLFAYLSIPSGPPPFPAIFFLPNYGSVVEPIPQGAPNALRGRYITFSLAVRGQRKADQPWAASFPGLLTEGIDDPSAYVFRSIVADCFRGVEYLVGRPEVDLSRVAAVGNDLALITAGLSGKVTHVVCTPQLFYKTAELAPNTDEYPLEEINDYLRHNPKKKAKVQKCLSYFDLRWVAPRVNSTTQIVGGAQGELLNRQVLQPLLQALGDRAAYYETEHSSYLDGRFVHEWIAGQFGYDDAILPVHWR